MPPAPAQPVSGSRSSRQTGGRPAVPRLSAKVSEIAHHLRLSPDTTRKRLDEAGIAPVAVSPERYAWANIWTRLEGLGPVAPGDEKELHKPLLTAEEVREAYFPELATRTITDRAKRDALPGVRLGDDWRFLDREVRKAARHG